MKISYNWLKEYVDFNRTPEELADDLSLFGHEVEEIIPYKDDFILDFEITPNRGDCLSILGMAREVAALYNTTVNLKEVEISDQDASKDIDIKVSDPKICPRYTARVIENIKIEPSPNWIREKLEGYGFRSLNNIVDITNLVMIETGQPLHAFDYNKIQNGKINIRTSKVNESVTTLDGVHRTLPENSIIIEDDEKIYDLAGIMGGVKSEIDDQTTTIILQGSIFDPVTIRKTSKKLKHTTDASYRYERGVDYVGTVYGVDLATSLIKQIIPNAEIGKLIDEKFLTLEQNSIPFDLSKINSLIGFKVDFNELEKMLKRLNFIVDSNQVIVPSYRNYDVKLWQDIAEEAARIYGYNTINKEVLTNFQSNDNLSYLKREVIKDILLELGFSEVFSYSFADKDKIELLGFDLKDCVEISNPLSPETQFLRPGLEPSLLAQAAKNPWAPDVNIFEIEKIFSKGQEIWQLGIATLGKSDKQILKAIERLGLKVEPIKVEQKVLDSYKIRRSVFMVNVSVDQINIDEKEVSEEISDKIYRPISKFAPTINDLAFIVDSSVDTKAIKESILSLDEKILLVELFDEFESEKFGINKKNVAFHIWIQDLNGPVDDIISNEIIEKIINKVEEVYSAQIRSNSNK